MVATRSRDFQLGLMLATALAVLVLPTAAEAYTPEGQQACTGDAFRLCSSEIPNIDRVRASCTGTRRSLVLAAEGSSAPGRTGQRRAAAERKARQILKAHGRVPLASPAPGDDPTGRPPEPPKPNPPQRSP
jgi:hypothetical protein